MEKKLILEIDRIGSLMGVKKILNEQGGLLKAFIDDLARVSPKLFKDFDNILKVAKVEGRELTDQEIDKFVNDCKKAGALTDNEADDLAKVLKTDKDLRKAMNGTDDFLSELHKIDPKKEVPSGFENIKNLSKLTQTQVDEIVDKTVNSFLKDTTKGIGKIFSVQDQIYSDFLSGLISERKMINNVDEIYDNIDGQINKILQDNVNSGKITAAEAKEFFEELSENFRCCSKTKAKLDEMLEGGYVAGKPKKTVTPKYGDDNFGVTGDKLKAYNDDGTEMIKPKTGFEEAEFFDEKRVSELGYMSRFYIKTFEPYTRWWLDQLRLFWDDIFGKVTQNGNKYLENFNSSFKRGFDEFTLTKGKMDRSYYMDIIEKFQRIPRGGDYALPNSSRSVYNMLWDDFVSNGKNYFKNDPQKLKDFNAFTDQILSYKSSSNKTLAMDEILNLDGFAKTNIETGFNERLSQVKNLTKFETYTNSIKEWLVERVINVWNLFNSGTFASPNEYSRYMIREIRANKKLAINGQKVFSTAYSKKAAVSYFLQRMAYAHILLPSAVAAIEMIYEGWVAATTNVRLYDRDLIYEDPSGFGQTIVNYLYGYALDDILSGVKIDNLIFGETEKNWSDYLGVVPGYRDDLLIGIIKLTGWMAYGGTGDKTPEQEAQETVENIKNGVEGKIPRDLKPMKESEKSKMHRDIDAAISGKGDLSATDKTLLIAYTYDDGTQVWTEDPYEEKKYKLILNPEWESYNLEQQQENDPYVWDDNGSYKSIADLSDLLNKSFNLNKKDENKNVNDTEDFLNQIKDSIKERIKNLLMENTTGKKFGDDNFKHWKDTFTFKSVDEKNPGQYKEVKINMEDVMDRINHYRKKYDEDDAFVRAVIDTHEDVVKVMFTKDLAHLQENHKPTGLAIILQQIKESRGEMEIWSVARPANGNWFLVKGDYTPNQLANMDLEKKEPQPKEKEVDSRTEDDLKKKEELALHNLKSNEKEGINDLPKQVRDKVNEKLSKGWTTEEPFFAFEEFYEVSEINSVFNDKIKIYKLNPSEEFFKTLVRESASVRVSRGFCKSLNQVKNQTGLVERQQKVLNHFIEKCENKFGNEPIKKYRQPRFND